MPGGGVCATWQDVVGPKGGTDRLEFRARMRGRVRDVGPVTGPYTINNGP